MGPEPIRFIALVSGAPRAEDVRYRTVIYNPVGPT